MDFSAPFSLTRVDVFPGINFTPQKNFALTCFSRLELSKGAAENPDFSEAFHYCRIRAYEQYKLDRCH